MLKIGVLALQGAFKEHIEIIQKLGHQAIEIKTCDTLDIIDGLILPGGESTTIGKLLVDYKIRETLIEQVENGLPIWGTCAGMILLAKQLNGDNFPHLKLMSIKVARNAYGRQLDSFVIEKLIPEVSENPIPLVFIRAPLVISAENNVKILAKVREDIVAVRENNMLATSFHPELTNDTSFHQYFIGMIKERKIL